VAISRQLETHHLHNSAINGRTSTLSAISAEYYVTSTNLKINSPILEVPAPTKLDVPARKSPTLDMSTQLAFLICSNSPLLRTLGCTASGPSNPHDPGPPAAIAGRTVALIYIILPIIMTTIQFATYDYLRICPRSPQCFYVMYFLCSV
jgi:hypothetical protein